MLQAELLRTELAHTRTKLESLLLEKEQAEDNVRRVQKVLESERGQLREGPAFPASYKTTAPISDIPLLVTSSQC